MAQLPPQILSNLNLHLSAESPEASTGYGAEEMYNNRKRNDGMYEEDVYEDDMYEREQQYPNSMYGRETSVEDSYDDEEQYEDENFDYGSRNDEYRREYQQNVNMSNFGYSPDIIGGDLINYDTPFANNDFDEREIIDKGGVPYGNWWNLDNILGDIDVHKGAKKDSMNDLFGFGVSDISGLTGISNKEFKSQSFDDLFGFGGVNAKGTLGSANGYDPQTMFGLFSKKTDPLQETGSGKPSIFNRISNAVKSIGGNKEQRKIDKFNKQYEKAHANDPNTTEKSLVVVQQPDKTPTPPASNDEPNENGEKGFLARKIEEHKLKKEERAEREHELKLKMIEAGMNPNSRGESSYFGGGGGSSTPRTTEIEIKSPNSDATAFQGIGEKGVDIFGFEKMSKASSEGGYGNADVFGFADMQEKEIGETDTFGFRQMSETEGEGATAQSQFGFKIGNEEGQSKEAMFGDLGGKGNSPMSFSDTFGFKDASDVPSSMANVFGIHIIGSEPAVAPITPVEKNPVKSPSLDESLGGEKNEPEVRADLSSLSTSSAPKTVYKTVQKPAGKKKSKKDATAVAPVAPATPASPQASAEPQTHAGMYTRVGRMFESNQDYASNFENYGYSLDVGGMFNGGGEDNQLIGFNSDVIGIGFGGFGGSGVKRVVKSTGKKSGNTTRKVRVTSFGIDSMGRVVSQSTKVNGKYVQKKSRKTKSSSKKKSTVKKQTVKKTKGKSKSNDDYFSSLIWG